MWKVITKSCSYTGMKVSIRFVQRFGVRCWSYTLIWEAHRRRWRNLMKPIESCVIHNAVRSMIDCKHCIYIRKLFYFLYLLRLKNVFILNLIFLWEKQVSLFVYFYVWIHRVHLYCENNNGLLLFFFIYLIVNTKIKRLLKMYTSNVIMLMLSISLLKTAPYKFIFSILFIFDIIFNFASYNLAW